MFGVTVTTGGAAIAVRQIKKKNVAIFRESKPGGGNNAARSSWQFLLLGNDRVPGTDDGDCDVVDGWVQHVVRSFRRPKDSATVTPSRDCLKV